MNVAIETLCAKAHEARQHAVAPYSGYRVGAAVLGADGHVYGGCNIEVSSFSHTCCAERVAIFKALSEGSGGVVAIAIASADASPAPPCGACRQVMSDFGGDDLVVALTNGTTVDVLRLADLLPRAFHPERLKRGGDVAHPSSGR